MFCVNLLGFSVWLGLFSVLFRNWFRLACFLFLLLLGECVDVVIIDFIRLVRLISVKFWLSLELNLCFG